MAAAATSTAPRWSAVYAMALCVTVLIASEFMPVSLLSPIAHDLGLSEGRAGSAISISGIFAVATSLSVTALAGRIDRRIVLLALSALLIGSGLLVALAPNFAVLMAGRALLGIGIGGFWSMSTATIMRLVPTSDVPKGLAIIYGGNAIASTVSAPFGSFLGSLIGWRGAFFCVVPLAALSLIWQAAALPRMPVAEKTSTDNPLRLLARPPVALGMAAVMLLFMGQFAIFTYLRPFLEEVTKVGIGTLSIILLIVGVAGFLGTLAIGRLLKHGVHASLWIIPLVMSGLAAALSAAGTSVAVTGLLLALWGLFSTAAPVGWSTWLTQVMPDDAEAGGGLLVAAIQLAITAGAGIGGIVFDAAGPVTNLWFGAILLLAAAFAAVLLGRQAGEDRRPDHASSIAVGAR